MKGAPLASVKHSSILLVADDDDNRYLCWRLLEVEGFAIETCRNGREALAFLDSRPNPCLILLDMMMPIMNRPEFWAAITKRPHSIAPIPVCLVSGTAESRDGKEMECFGFLKMPVDFDALLFIVRTHCSMKSELLSCQTEFQSHTMKIADGVDNDMKV